jgi:hypothetical protein
VELEKRGTVVFTQRLVAKKVCKKLKCPMGIKKIAGYLGATTMSIKPSELKQYKKNLR